MPARLLALVAALLCVGCQQAYLDGAWSGTMECSNVDYDVDAQFEQRLETQDVEGSFFIEYEIDLGLFGRHRIWEKGVIDEGEWDPRDDSIAGRIDPVEGQANGEAPAWRFELSPNDEYDELSGELEQLNPDNDVVRTCDAELELVGLPGN